MKALQYILASIVALLFPFGYWICLYIYPDDNIKFFDLRMNLIACFMFCSFLFGYLVTDNKKLRFILDIGMGMSIADLVDRFYFNVTTFEKSDITMIILTILFAIIDYNKTKVYNFLCQLLK